MPRWYWMRERWVFMCCDLKSCCFFFWQGFTVLLIYAWIGMCSKLRLHPASVSNQQPASQLPKGHVFTIPKKSQLGGGNSNIWGKISPLSFLGIHDLQIDWRTHIFSDGLKLNHQLDKDLPAHHARMLRWPLPMLCVAATRGRWGVVLAGDLGV